jgi:polysaccharide pyruvyl transferase WcaK-like protein
VNKPPSAPDAENSPEREASVDGWWIPALQKKPTIAIWGHYHGGNLGDEVVVTTIIDAIRRRVPGARPIGICQRPADATARHGIPAFPIMPGLPTANRPDEGRRTAPRLRAGARAVRPLQWARGLARKVALIAREGPFLWRSYRLLRKVDLVVVAGSGPLTDGWQGSWQHPYRVFRWAMLARLARVPMIYPSVGAGPIDADLSAFFIRRAVKSSAWISVRDRYAGEVLASIGLDRAVPVCPDMAYGMPEELRTAPGGTRHNRAAGLIVGLNVMGHRDPRYWPRGDQAGYEEYVEKMASFAQWLIDNRHTIRFFSTQTRSDPAVADDVYARLSVAAEPSRGEIVYRTDDLQDFMALVARCDVAVAARFHSVLIPLLLGIPVLGLAYNPKTTELLAAIGRGEQCLDIDTFEVAELIDVFEKLLASVSSASTADLGARVTAQREAVERQFDTIFGPLLPQSRSAQTLRAVT